MLRYLKERLLEENLTGNGIMDVIANTLSETAKCIQSNSEPNDSAGDSSVAYQLLGIIGSLQAYLSKIECIDVKYFTNKTSPVEDNYVNIEKKKGKKTLKSIDSKRLKFLTSGRSEEYNEAQNFKQGESKSSTGKRGFQLFRPYIKMSKSAGNDARQIYRKKNIAPTYSNSVSRENSPRSQRSPLRRFHSTENFLTSKCDQNGEVDQPTYDVPFSPRIYVDDSDSDTDGYISLNTSQQHSMPKEDNTEQVVKVKLKVNTKDLGNRFCVLRDVHLLIGEELNGSVAEFVCALTQYSIDYELSDDHSFCLCLTHNGLNMSLCFESEKEYNEWAGNIKSAMLRVKYVSVNFSNHISDNVYDCVEQPIYERISLLLEESQILMLEPTVQ